MKFSEPFSEQAITETPDGVGHETPRPPGKRDKHTGQGRPHEPGAIHQRGVKGDGVRAVFLPRDHVHEECLASGHVECVYQALE
jgi:hypothetical protein